MSDIPLKTLTMTEEQLRSALNKVGIGMKITESKTTPGLLAVIFYTRSGDGRDAAFLIDMFEKVS